MACSASRASSKRAAGPSKRCRADDGCRPRSRCFASSRSPRLKRPESATAHRLPPGDGSLAGDASVGSLGNPAHTWYASSSGSRAASHNDWLASIALALTILAYAVLAAGYATRTPVWQNPDEPAHFNYVAFVAESGGLPELKPGDWDSPLLERLKNGRLQPGDDVGTIRYEGWQPPLFYVLAAPIYRLVRTEDRAGLVLRLRAFDAVLGAATLGVAYLVGRELFGPRLAFGPPLAMIGVPMFTSVSASISADPLANLLAAGLVLALIRRVGRPPADAVRWALGCGVLLGLGLLTKLAIAIFTPLIVGVLVWRARRPLREMGLVAVVAGGLLVPWLVHQVTTYGWLDPLATARHAAVVLDQQRFPGLSFEYLGAFARVTFQSFWAQFGWMGIVAPDRLYLVYGLWSGVAAIGLWRARRRLATPAWRLMPAVLAAALIGLIAYNLTFEQFQGRYLFPALVPIVALLVAGWAAWLPRSAQHWGVLLVGVVLAGLNAYALVRVLAVGFAPAG